MNWSRSNTVFMCQTLVIFAVVITSLYNLTTGVRDKENLWTALLSTSLGLVIPAPTLKPRDKPELEKNGADINTSERQLNAVLP